MTNYRIRVWPDDEVFFHGVEEPTATLHYRAASGIIVVKIPGHNYWSSRGQQSYAGAVFRVLRILEEEVADDTGVAYMYVEKIVEFPVRK